MELVSVIIPAYNVDKYLERCLDSICGQSYSNLEIIVVDDGSSDGTPGICDRYASMDSRIRVIHKQNEGVAVARNCALDMASGKRLAFSDADDYYEPDMIMKLNNAMNLYDSDMAVCGYYEEHSDRTDIHVAEEDAVIYDKIEAYKEYFRMGSKIGSGCWNKMIKAEAVGNLRFKSYRMGEDVEWISRVIDNCDTVVCIGHAGYHYVHRGDSATRNGFSEANLDILHVSDEMVDNIKQHHPELIKNAYAYHAAWHSAQIQWMHWFGDKREHAQEEKYLRHGVISNLKNYINNPYIVRADRIYIYSYILGIYKPVKWAYDMLIILKRKIKA